MARPIAGINQYPYGVCGYIVNGVHFHNQTTATTLRIYKQRSDVMFDLIDPNTGTVYQKLLLTGTDTFGLVLDYSLTDAQLVNMIPRNTFFVRGYNPSHSIEGFVVRWLLNKKILSNGKVLYDIYTPECGIPPIDISNVILEPIEAGDTSINGIITVPSGTVITDGLVISATLPDGTVVYGTVNSDGTFTIPVLVPDDGKITITITSPNYNEKVVEVDIIPDGNDSDYVTSILVPSAQQTLTDGNYVSTVPAATHGRGDKLVIQLQTTNSNIEVFGADVSVVNGDITVSKIDDSEYNIIIIGKTLKTEPFSTDIVWASSNDNYIFNVPKSVHGKSNISVSVYNGSNLSTVEVDLEADEEIVIKSDINFTGYIVIAGKE